MLCKLSERWVTGMPLKNELIIGFSKLLKLIICFLNLSQTSWHYKRQHIKILYIEQEDINYSAKSYISKFYNSFKFELLHCICSSNMSIILFEQIFLFLQLCLSCETLGHACLVLGWGRQWEAMKIVTTPFPSSCIYDHQWCVVSTISSIFC